MQGNRVARIGLGCLCLLAGAAGPVFGEPDWKMLAEQWLGATFPEPGARWQAWILSAPDGSKWAGNGRIVGLAGQSRRPKKIMRLVVADAGSDSPWGEILVNAGRWRKVAVANRLLARGESLRPEDWHWEERAVESLPLDTVRQAEELADKQIKKVLTVSEVITAHALEPVPDVRFGQRLRLWVRGEGVLVSMEAEALEAGRIGDCLRLKNPDSGKIITARITGLDRAEINLKAGGESR